MEVKRELSDRQKRNIRKKQVEREKVLGQQRRRKVQLPGGTWICVSDSDSDSEITETQRQNEARASSSVVNAEDIPMPQEEQTAPTVERSSEVISEPGTDEHSMFDIPDFEQEFFEEREERLPRFMKRAKREPLYPSGQAQVSVHECNVMFNTLANETKMPGTTLNKVLKAVSLILPKGNKFPNSRFKLKKYFADLKAETEKVYYCEICENEIEDADVECRFEHSEAQLKKTPARALRPYFSVLDIRAQLVKVVEKNYNSVCTTLDSIENRMIQENDVVRDMYDGQLYCDFYTPRTITLMMYEDGVKLYRFGSRTSLWPIYFCVNELPPNRRLMSDNIVVYGLWCSNKKPNPDLFLGRLHAAMRMLKQDGIEVIDKNGIKRSFNVKILCMTADAPARALFTNFSQFNGFYGCNKCLTHGKLIALSGKKSGVMSYPYEGNLTLRTKEHTNETILKMHQEGKSRSFGIRGRNLLHSLVPDIIRSVPIDPMHAYVLGVTKKALAMLIAEKLFVKNGLQLLDYRLLSIRYPASIQAQPRSVIREINQWNAKDYKNLILYLLPLLGGIIPEEQYKNLLLLSEGLYGLWKSAVKKDEIDSCEHKLNDFVQGFENLYGVRHMTYNIHTLRHAAQCVRELGPLWVFSCFAFEWLNGKIVEQVHGSRYPEDQIASAVTNLMFKEEMVNSLQMGPVRAHCEKLLSPVLLAEKYRINPYTYLGGKEDSDVLLSDAEKHAVILKFGTYPRRVTYYGKIKIHSLVFNTDRNTNLKDTSYITYKLPDSLITSYGQIKKILKLEFDDETLHCILVTNFNAQPHICGKSEIRHTYVKEVVPTNKLHTISAENIMMACFHYHLEEKEIAVPIVNPFEVE